MSGLIRINAIRIVRYLLITVVLLASVTLGLRIFFALAIDNTYDKDKIIAGMQLLHNLVPEELHLTPPTALPALPDEMSRLQAVRERGTLRPTGLVAVYHRTGSPNCGCDYCRDGIIGLIRETDVRSKDNEAPDAG